MERPFATLSLFPFRTLAKGGLQRAQFLYTSFSVPVPTLGRSIFNETISNTDICSHTHFKARLTNKNKIKRDFVVTETVKNKTISLNSTKRTFTCCFSQTQSILMQLQSVVKCF